MTRAYVALVSMETAGTRIEIKHSAGDALEKNEVGHLLRAQLFNKISAQSRLDDSRDGFDGGERVG